MAGRPPIYSDELATEVLARLAMGRSLRSVCDDADMPAITTVMKWLRESATFAQHYASAREDRAEVMFEELDDIGEEAAMAESAVKVAGLRLKADNVKWKLARMHPKKYGDKIETTHAGAIDHSLTINFVNK